MQILAQLALIVLCLLMFKVDRKYKLAILLLSAICFNCVRISFIPFGLSRFILCNCFLLSELPYIMSHIKTIKQTILKSLILTMIVATVILAIHSPHYNSPLQYTRLIIMELIAKYFIICYAFVSIRNESDLRPSFNIAYYGLLILTIFAILNYITKHAVFINEMLKGMTLVDVMQDAGDKFTFADRFRVQAMFFNPFDYGYVCICLFLFHWYGYIKSFITKIKFYIASVCCLFGIITCGCRTVMLCTLIACAVYVLAAFNLKKSIKYCAICILIGTILLSFVPFMQDKMNEMLSMFDKNSSIGGSSVEMRILQYTAVLYHIRNHFLFGRGLDFFNIDMGWAEGKQFLVDRDLQGIEGVLMNQLLERGIVGVCFYLFFYCSLIIYCLKNSRIDKLTSALFISILTTYLAFANMTGELNSILPTLLISGICIKLLYNRKQLS